MDFLSVEGGRGGFFDVPGFVSAPDELYTAFNGPTNLAKNPAKYVPVADVSCPCPMLT